MSEQTQLNFGGGNTTNQPVTVLGKTFANDDERRKYFREELRKKLPELKQIEGYPIGEDDDIIELSDPPYYTACPNPWLNDFVAQWELEKKDLEKEGKRSTDFEIKEPYASDVSEGKNNPIYNAHSYHTKVPHPAIMRYILHYTQPGDIVLDGFCGTGMTGVAAQMCESPDKDLKNKIEYEFKALGYSQPVWGKRNAILGDLSPIASFISYNYNRNFSAEKFNYDCKKIIDEVKNKFDYLYITKHTDGSDGYINYVIWSDIFNCPNCANEIVYWDEAYDSENGCLLDSIICPQCGASHKKSKLSKCWITYFDYNIDKIVKCVKSIPVIINYTAKDGKKYRKKPDYEDLENIKRINDLKISSWIPTSPLPNGDKMSDPLNKGITCVHHFYEKRSLLILSEIWNKLSFKNYIVLTNCIARNATIMNRFIVNKYNPNGRINGPFTGTLYCPSERVEQNIFSLIEEKRQNYSYSFLNLISINSATNLPMESNSIDYIFTDPPFGKNFMYSELNFIQESWLKVKTNNIKEAIINKTQTKRLVEYCKLMEQSFKEYYRILKPSKWLTVEFSNTEQAVWNSIRFALQRAGFILANVAVLDKVHGGIKAMTYDTTVKQDLVISCYKPSEEFTKNFLIQDSNANVWNFVAEHIEHLPLPSMNEHKSTAVIERSPKVLYDRLITYFLMRNLPVPIDAVDFQEGLRSRYKIEDGMVFTEKQYLEFLELKKNNKQPEQLRFLISVIENESDAIQWIKEKLKDNPLKYQDIQPDYRKAYAVNRKGEIEIELRDILEENFIENDDHTWRIPNLEEQKDREILRTKALLKTWNEYVSAIERNGKKLKDVRLEALRAGFKDCIDKKDYQTIVRVGDKIPENILTEDEILLNYYDIASNKI